MLARSRTALRRSPQCADTRIGSERIRVTVAMISQQVDRGGRSSTSSGGLAGERPGPFQSSCSSAPAWLCDTTGSRGARARARLRSTTRHAPPNATQPSYKNAARNGQNRKDS